MMKVNLLIVLALCVAGACPASSISRWFTTSYQDLRYSLLRYGWCYGDLVPLRDHNLNETEYLTHQMKVFLDQANYDNEQLANVSALMDSICRTEDYPISLNLNIDKYVNNTGKANRCQSIDEVLEVMYPVLRKAALNRSEPLDFSVIKLYANASDKATAYNFTDLINTSWIKSDTPLDLVCDITNSVKEFVASRSSNVTAQKRDNLGGLTTSKGVLSSLMDFLDRILDPILGLQKRLYWESNNRLEQAYSGLANQVGNLRNAVGRTYTQTRKAISNVFGSSAGVNGTIVANSTVNKAKLEPVSISPNLQNRFDVKPNPEPKSQSGFDIKPKPESNFDIIPSKASLNQTSTANLAASVTYAK